MGIAASRQEAFWEACGFGHVDRVKKFLEDKDIDVNWVSYTHDCCPIHVASQGKPEIVQMLLNADCNVNVKDIRGHLPIHHAAMKGHADIIQTLIDNGSEIDTQDKNGWTAVHCAAYWNYPEAVRVLIENGANVHLQNKDERTALHETARSPEQNDQKLGEISRLLIDAGCDINAKSSDLGEADFTGLMFASYHNHPEVSSAFIEAGCDINAQGTNLWTALHWAADRGNEEMVYLLLESGADPTMKGLRGELAADRTQNPDIKEVLLNAVNMWEELNKLSEMQKPQNNECIGLNSNETAVKKSPSNSKHDRLVQQHNSNSEITNAFSITEETKNFESKPIRDSNILTEQKHEMFSLREQKIEQNEQKWKQNEQKQEDTVTENSVKESLDLKGETVSSTTCEECDEIVRTTTSSTEEESKCSKGQPSQTFIDSDKSCSSISSENLDSSVKKSSTNIEKRSMTGIDDNHDLADGGTCSEVRKEFEGQEPNKNNIGILADILEDGLNINSENNMDKEPVKNTVETNFEEKD